MNVDRFATCGLDKNIYMWTLRGKTILAEEASYDVDYLSRGIHYMYKGTYYCALIPIIPPSRC